MADKKTAQEFSVPPYTEPGTTPEVDAYGEDYDKWVAGKNFKSEKQAKVLWQEKHFKNTEAEKAFEKQAAPLDAFVQDKNENDYPIKKPENRNAPNSPEKAMSKQDVFELFTELQDLTDYKDLYTPASGVTMKRVANQGIEKKYLKGVHWKGDQRANAAAEQPWQEQARRAVGTAIPQGLMTAVEDFSYLAELSGILEKSEQEDGERINNVAKLMQMGKESLRENNQVYSNEFGDAGWYWNGVNTVIDNSIGFMIPGAVVGKLGRGVKLARGASKLYATLSKANKIKALRRAYLMGKGAEKLGTAFVMNYAESEMIGSEIFQATNKELLALGYDKEEAAKMANSQARTYANWNKLFIFDELLHLNSLVGRGAFTHSRNMLAKRTALSTAKEYGLSMGAEATQEGIQGFFTSEAVRKARQKAMDEGKTKNIYGYSSSIIGRAVDYLGTEDAANNMLLGAVGAVGMKGSMDIISNAKKSDRETYKAYYNSQEGQIAANEELLKKNLDAYIKLEQDKEAAIVRGDKGDFDRLNKEGFAHIAYENFSKGTTEKLEDSLKEIASLSKEEAAERGFGEGYKENAEKNLKALESLEYEYNALVDTYQTQDARPFHKALFMFDTKKKMSEEAITDKYRKKNDGKAELISRYKEATGKDLSPEQHEDMEAYFEAVQAEYIKGVYKERIAETKSEAEKKQLEDLIKPLDKTIEKGKGKLGKIPRDVRNITAFDKYSEGSMEHYAARQQKEIYARKYNDLASPNWRTEIHKELDGFAIEAVDQASNTVELETVKAASKMSPKVQEAVTKKEKELAAQEKAAQAKQDAKDAKEVVNGTKDPQDTSWAQSVGSEEELDNLPETPPPPSPTEEPPAPTQQTQKPAKTEVAIGDVVEIGGKKYKKIMSQEETPAPYYRAEGHDGFDLDVEYAEANLDIQKTLKDAVAQDQAQEIVDANTTIEDLEDGSPIAETVEGPIEGEEEVQHSRTVIRYVDRVEAVAGTIDLAGLGFNQPILEGYVNKVYVHDNIKNGKREMTQVIADRYKAMKALKEGDVVTVRFLTAKELESKRYTGWKYTTEPGGKIAVVEDQHGNEITFLHRSDVDKKAKTLANIYKDITRKQEKGILPKGMPVSKQEVEKLVAAQEAELDKVRQYLGEVDKANPGARIKLTVSNKRNGSAEFRTMYGGAVFSAKEPGRSVADTFTGSVKLGAIADGDVVHYENGDKKTHTTPHNSDLNGYPNGTIVAITEESGETIRVPLTTKKVGNELAADMVNEIISIAKSDLTVAEKKAELQEKMPLLQSEGVAPSVTFGESTLTFNYKGKDASAGKYVVHFDNGSIDFKPADGRKTTKHPLADRLIKKKNGWYKFDDQFTQPEFDGLMHSAIAGQTRQVDIRTVNDGDMQVTKDTETLEARVLINVDENGNNLGVLGGTTTITFDTSSIPLPGTKAVPNNQAKIDAIEEKRKLNLYQIYQQGREEAETKKIVKEINAKYDAELAALKGETYNGIQVIESDNIMTKDGPSAAQYDRDANTITVNRPLLKQKFEEKAWTSPRPLTELLHGIDLESFATALPEGQFATYQEFENFVMEHEFQHSLLSRAQFKEGPNMENSTLGEYEDEINRRALEVLKPATGKKDVRNDAATKKANDDMFGGLASVLERAPSADERIVPTEATANLQKILPQVGVIWNKDSIVWGNGYAQGLFRNTMIELSKNAHKGTEFHEAFHAVMHLYLDKSQRDKVYADALAEMGEPGFVSDRELEEFMADKFKRYMRTDGKITPKGNLLQRLFKDLLNYINVILGNKSYTDTLFEKIASKRFDKPPTLAALKYAANLQLASEMPTSLSPLEMKQATESVAHMVVNIQDKLVNSKTSKNKKAFKQTMLAVLARDGYNKAVEEGTLEEDTDDLYAEVKESNDLTTDKKMVNAYVEKFVTNQAEGSEEWAKVATDFKMVFKAASDLLAKDYSIDLNQDLDLDENQELTKDWNNGGFLKQNAKANARTRTRHLLRRTIQLKPDKTVKTNFLGVPMFLEFDFHAPFLFDKLAGAVDEFDALRKLRALAKYEPSYESIIGILEKDMKTKENKYGAGWWSSFGMQKTVADTVRREDKYISEQEAAMLHEIGEPLPKKDVIRTSNTLNSFEARLSRILYNKILDEGTTVDPVQAHKSFKAASIQTKNFVNSQEKDPIAKHFSKDAKDHENIGKVYSKGLANIGVVLTKEGEDLIAKSINIEAVKVYNSAIGKGDREAREETKKFLSKVLYTPFTHESSDIKKAGVFQLLGSQNSNKRNILKELKKFSVMMNNNNLGMSENSYLNSDGEITQSIVQSHFLSDMLNRLHSDDLTIVKRELKELLADPRNRHSNFIRAILSARREKKESLEEFSKRLVSRIDTLSDKEVENLRNISTSILNGAENNDTKDSASYSKMSDNDWLASMLAGYMDKLGFNSEKGGLQNGEYNLPVYFSMPTPGPSDSSVMNLMTFPRYIHRVDPTTGKAIGGVYSASQAMKNIYRQERTKIESTAATFDKVFGKNENGTWNFDDVLDVELEKKLEKNLHFKETAEGRDYSKAQGLRFAPFTLMQATDDTVSGVTTNQLLEDLVLDPVTGRPKPLSAEDVQELNRIMDGFMEEVHQDTLSLYERARNKDTEAINARNKDGQRTRESRLFPGFQENMPHMKDFALNHFIWNYEITNLFTGGLESYKNVVDLNKRFKQIQAPGVKPSTHILGHDFSVATLADIEIASKNIENLFEAATAALLEGGDISKAITLEEFTKAKESGKDLSKNMKAIDKVIGGYFNVNVADAQGYVTLDRYEKLVDSLGELTPAVKSSIDKARYGVPLSLEDMKNLQPHKFFYYGKVHSTHLGISTPKQIKYSTVPLIPQLTKGSDLDAVRQRMESTTDPIDEVVFDSAFKVGRTVANKVTDAKGKLIEGALDNLVSERLPNKHLRKQLDVPDHVMDTYNKLGSQLTKLAISNIHDDIMYNVPGYLFKEIMKRDPSKEERDGGRVQLPGAKIKELMLDKISNLATASHAELMTRITGKDGKLDKKALRSILLSDAKRRNANQNYIDALDMDSDGNFSMPLFYSAMATVFESSLTSMWTNNVTSQQMPGGSAVQLSNAFFENRDQADLSAEDTQGIMWSKKWLKSNPTKELKYRVGDNGVIEVDALLPPYSEAFFKDGDIVDFDTLFAPKIDPKTGDERLRNLISYRIPTESKAQIIKIKVVGFLPKASGSAIVLPHEITTKTGADFDVDKMFFMQFNMYRDKNDALRIGTSRGEGVSKEQVAKEQAQNDILHLVQTVLGNPSHMLETITGQDFTDLSDAKKAELELEDNAADAIDYYTLRGQNTFRKRNTAGITLKGVAANFNSFGAIMQVAKAELTQGFSVSYPKSEISKKMLMERFGIEADKISENKDNYYFSLNKLGWSNDFKNIDGDNTLAHASQTLAAVLDIVKDPTFEPLNLDMYTLPTFSTMLLLGIPINYASKWVSQPALRELAEASNGSKGALNSGFFQTKQDAPRIGEGIIKRVLTKEQLDKLTSELDALPEETDFYTSITANKLLGYNRYSPTKAEMDRSKRINTKLTKGEDVSDADRIFFANMSLNALQKYENFDDTSRSVNNMVSAIKFDAIGAGPTIADNRGAISSIEELVGSSKIMTGDTPLVDAIFPKTATEQYEYQLATMVRTDENEGEVERLEMALAKVKNAKSVYSPLETYLELSNKDSLEKLETEFIYESPAFRAYLSSLMPSKGTKKFKEAARKKITKFGMGYVMKEFGMFSEEELARVVGMSETFTGAERQKIYDTPFEELPAEDFVKLGLATKIKLIQMSGIIEQYPALNNYFLPLTGVERVIGNKGARHVDFIKEEGNSVLADEVITDLRNLFTSDNAFLKSVSEDFIKYSMATNGIQFGYKSIANYLPISVLAGDEVRLNKYLYGRQQALNASPMGMDGAREAFLRNHSNDPDFSERVAFIPEAVLKQSDGVLLLDNTYNRKEVATAVTSYINQAGQQSQTTLTFLHDHKLDVYNEETGELEKKGYKLTEPLGSKGEESFKTQEYYNKTQMPLNKIPAELRPYVREDHVSSSTTSAKVDLPAPEVVDGPAPSAPIQEEGPLPDGAQDADALFEKMQQQFGKTEEELNKMHEDAKKREEDCNNSKKKK